MIKSSTSSEYLTIYYSKYTKISLKFILKKSIEELIIKNDIINIIIIVIIIDIEEDI